jgi:hypothetical protein
LRLGFAYSLAEEIGIVWGRLTHPPNVIRVLLT